MEVCLSRTLAITTANFSQVEIQLPKHHKLCEVTNAPKEILHIKDERFWYTIEATPTKNDESISAVHYKPSPDRLEQRAKHKVVKEKDEANLEKMKRRRPATCQIQGPPTSLFEND